MYTITRLVKFIFLAGLTATFAAPLGNNAELENRETFQHTCHHDNCLRALLSPRHSLEAVSFCGTYVLAHIYTIDITETITSTFNNQLVQPFATITNTSFATTYITATTTHSHSLPSPPPRTSSLSLLPRYPPPSPPFLSACSSPSNLSSACSCLIAPITFITHTVDITVAMFGGTTTLPIITVTEENVVTEVETSIVTIFEP